MSKISVYTTTTNAIRDEFFLVEGIRSSLKFADEVVVVDGGSTDSTMSNILSVGDSRIAIYEQDWLDNIGIGMYGIMKSMALGRCTGDWCILMDADEVFHEADIDRIKRCAESVSENICAIEFNTIHFYKDYFHILNGVREWKDLYTHRVQMVRNGMGIYHGNLNGDPDAFLLSDGTPIPHDRRMHAAINVFHYGHVRTEESYLRKMNKMHEKWAGKDYKEKTYIDWIPTEKLSTFSGPHPAVMRERVSVGTDSYDRIMSLYVV